MIKLSSSTFSFLVLSLSLCVCVCVKLCSVEQGREGEREIWESFSIGKFGEARK